MPEKLPLKLFIDSLQIHYCMYNFFSMVFSNTTYENLRPKYSNWLLLCTKLNKIVIKVLVREMFKIVTKFNNL